MTSAAGAPSAHDTAGGPLSGTCVLVTRARHQAAALVEPLEALGAEVLVASVIDTVEPDDWAPADVAIARLSDYDWIILTSTNAVDRFLGRLGEQGIPRAALGGARIAVVGAATADRLGEPGLAADLVPADSRAEGLRAAQAGGVVNRDRRPENVLFGRDEKGELLLKILDFGLAKTTLIDAARPESLTVPGTVLGTMGYMSPEQIEGKAVDPRSDIFSVGILLAEALTGRPPFRGTTLRELLYSTMTHEFRLPGEEPGILALNAVLARCLAKERDERYLNVEALKRELLPALDACPAIAGSRTASDVDVPTTRLSDDPGEPAERGTAPE